ncbi:hypothetical protein [Flavobacterium sp. 3-210]
MDNCMSTHEPCWKNSKKIAIDYWQKLQVLIPQSPRLEYNNRLNLPFLAESNGIGEMEKTNMKQQ